MIEGNQGTQFGPIRRDFIICVISYNLIEFYLGDKSSKEEDKRAKEKERKKAKEKERDEKAKEKEKRDKEKAKALAEKEKKKKVRNWFVLVV